MIVPQHRLFAAAKYAIVQHQNEKGVIIGPVSPKYRSSLKGKKGLIFGIAKRTQIDRWGCAKAFSRRLGLISP